MSLRVAAGLLGQDKPLHEVGTAFGTVNSTEASLQDIAQAARRLGLHAVGTRIRGDSLERCTVPVVAHVPPDHFAVLIGLGTGKGVVIVDPPHGWRMMSRKELQRYESWNAVAISRCPLSVEGYAEAEESSELPADDRYVSVSQGQLELSPAVVNFGAIPPGSIVQGNCLIRNRGESAVAIDRLVTNCQCITATVEPLFLEPGATAVLTTRMNTTGFLGFIRKEIRGSIQTVGSDKVQSFVVHTTGKVTNHGQLTLIPEEIDLGDIVCGTSLRYRARIRRVGGESINFEGVTCMSPAVRLRVLDVLPETVGIEIEVFAQEKPDELSTELIVKTDHADYPLLVAPIRWSAVSDVTAEPPRLFLGLMAPGKPLKQSITLKSRTSRPFRVEQVSTTGAAIFARCEAVLPDETEWNVTLHCLPAPRPGLAKGEVVIVLGGTSTDLIRMPFTAMVLP